MRGPWLRSRAACAFLSSLFRCLFCRTRRGSRYAEAVGRPIARGDGSRPRKRGSPTEEGSAYRRPRGRQVGAWRGTKRIQASRLSASWRRALTRIWRDALRMPGRSRFNAAPAASRNPPTQQAPAQRDAGSLTREAAAQASTATPLTPQASVQSTSSAIRHAASPAAAAAATTGDPATRPASGRSRPCAHPGGDRTLPIRPTIIRGRRRYAADDHA